MTLYKLRYRLLRQVIKTSKPANIRSNIAQFLR